MDFFKEVEGYFMQNSVKRLEFQNLTLLLWIRPILFPKDFEESSTKRTALVS